MWMRRGRHTVGRPRSTWDTMIQNLCTYQHLGHWNDVLGKRVNFKCFRTALRWKDLRNLFAPTPWKIYSATSCGCFRMRAGGFVLIRQSGSGTRRTRWPRKPRKIGKNILSSQGWQISHQNSVLFPRPQHGNQIAVNLMQLCTCRTSALFCADCGGGLVVGRRQCSNKRLAAKKTAAE